MNKLKKVIQMVLRMVFGASKSLNPPRLGDKADSMRLFSFTDHKEGDMFYSEEGRELNRLHRVKLAFQILLRDCESEEARDMALEQIEKIDLEIDRMSQLHGVMVP